MIGVAGDVTDRDLICEFFELFKTPWEFYRRGRKYDVLLCVGDCEPEGNARVAICFAGSKTRCDESMGFRVGPQLSRPSRISFQGNSIPIYGDTVTFLDEKDCFLAGEETHGCMGFLRRGNGRVIARIGYDLFGEVRKLLEEGQPVVNAQQPTLEMHIELLRDLITGCGVALYEIPPAPEGHRFIVCLTHDVDHPLIGRHKCDRTMFGFLYRATLGSIRSFFRGRVSARNLLSNFGAALKLPFVYMGVAKDFWGNFGDRYLKAENGLRSTFFVIPFKGRPGNKRDGQAPNYRASGYGARDLETTIQRLIAAGCEIGLHGIDAWLDSASGREEMNEIARLTGTQSAGVRMHWLYYDQQSPRALEGAGAAYDSTVGYNQTVGYKAGTTQVFKPLGANRLLELPLHAMDTAMFYPDYLGLSSGEATALLGKLVENVSRYEGCLTINWHDRSLAPERLWGDAYGDLLKDLRKRGVWFATVSQAVAWFRKRRSAVFKQDGTAPEVVIPSDGSDEHDRVPGLRLRVHERRMEGDILRGGLRRYQDSPVAESAEGAHEVPQSLPMRH